MANERPTTIISTVITVPYVTAAWVAFPCFLDEVPAAATEVSASGTAFWLSDDSVLVGRGDTPDEALADMKERNPDG